MNSQTNTVSSGGCCGAASRGSLGSTRLGKYLPAWLLSTRGLILGAVIVAAGGAALGWPWLVAIGAAPILLAFAPCAVMCALGLCMMGKGSKSAGAQGPSTGAAISSGAPALLSDGSGHAPVSALAHDREQVTLS